MSFMSWTITSQDGHAARFTVSITSLHTLQPALNTSTFRFVAISIAPILAVLYAKATPWS
jgi:hypothetical protein